MKPALDQKAAKKRIRRFFDEPMAERRAVAHFIDEVSVCADVFVFGGALRDISLLGAPRFNSDVDTVVQVHDSDAFMDILGRHASIQNKFGGHRVRFGRWNFDVWEVARTWAFSTGAVEARSPLSLLETTFFNWDAILYDWRFGSLHHGQNYFSELSDKYLELVLEDNPNTVGALVRTLRTLCMSDEILAGPRLSKFVKDQFGNISDQEILSYEARSFASNRLTDGLLSDMRARALDWDIDMPFHWLPRQQLSLFDELVH
jgi:predicted nucleotidyltransferase